MQMQPSTSIREIPFSKALLKQIIEEKLEGFGFLADNEQVLRLELDNMPDTFIVKVKLQKEKEVEVVRRKYNGSS